MGRNPQHAIPLAQLVEVRGRFHRSVQLPQDWAASNAASEYFLTPALSDTAERILEELVRPGGIRAWTLTGPYGCGKSAFAHFLTGVVASTPAHPLARVLRNTHLHRTRHLQPLLIQAERAPLVPELLEAVRKAAVPRRLASRARYLLKNGATGSDTARLLADMAAESSGGILLVVDELGKFLEYAASENGADIFLLQQIAEAAARSPKPFLFAGILHSGFQDYAANGGEALRAEWQKVQGRFHDIAFSLPGEQMLDLVGQALKTEFPASTTTAYTKRLADIVDASAFDEQCARKGFRERLVGCLPLHPISTLILWPLFRSKIAQNERSLFAFLTSHEPHGFQEFLRTRSADADQAPMYGVPELYDYVVGALGTATFSGVDARQWGLIEHAIRRIPADAPQVQRELVKTVGLLGLYGATQGARPGAEVLQRALDHYESGVVDAAIATLQERSILVFRRHLQAFGLWEGSDVDLDGAFERARGRVGEDSLAKRIVRHCTPQPLAARAHYIKTGTLRYFDVRISESDREAVEAALAQPSDADGTIVFLADPERSQNFCMRLARQISREYATDKPLLVAVPEVPRHIREPLDEIECCAWIREQVHELDGDPVARQELAARADAARKSFERTAGRMFGLSGHLLDPAASRWFLSGRLRRIAAPRALQELLSTLCDKAYPNAPKLHNELINRRKPSTAAARAQRLLLDRLVRDGHREKLGIAGFPPEVSVYEAFLAGGGFHAGGQNGSWRLKAPGTKSTWKPVWDEIERFLNDARQQRRPLTELFEILSAPPYGLRSGPLPLLMAVMLLVKGEEVALYEDEVFVPDPGIETLERLARRPDTFALRSFRLSARERKVIDALGDPAHPLTVDVDASDRGKGNLLAIVRDLVRTVEFLPPYTKHTRRISEDARALRDTLRDARDPRALLFEELPKALHCEFHTPDGASKFAQRLRDALRGLRHAYPNLLEEMEARLGDAFNIPERGQALRELLQRRAAALRAHAGSPQLRLFLNALAETRGANGHDWREDVARAIAGGNPPQQWRDPDALACATRLRLLAAECDTLGELVASSGNGEMAVASISWLEPGAGARRSVVSFSGEDGDQIAALADEIHQAGLQSGLDAPARLRALAMASRPLLDQAETAATTAVREAAH